MGVDVQGAGAAASCSFDAGKTKVTVGIGAEPATIATSSGGAITVDGAPCGTASTSNTDRIRVRAGSEENTVRLDLSAPLGPGKTLEGTTAASEIEVDLMLASGRDTLTLLGRRAGIDRWTLGTGGANVNGDGDGDDVRWSGVEDFRLVSFAGNDVLSLGGGAGTGSPLHLFGHVFAGHGDDRVTGGAGDDDLYADADTEGAGPRSGGDDTVDGGAKGDLIIGGPGSDTLHGGDHNDRICGGAGDDALYGDTGNDAFDALDVPDCVAYEADGADTISGGGGDRDWMTYAGRSASVRVRLDGAAGDGEAGEGDRVDPDVEVLFGGSGDDVLDAAAPVAATGLSRFLLGQGGDDRLYGSVTDKHRISDGGGSIPVLDGGPDDDVIVGTDSEEYLLGDIGNDVLRAGGSNDFLEGGDGDDYVHGGDGDDELTQGFDLNAQSLAPDGADTLSGGDGRDGVSYAGRTSNIRVTLDDVRNDGADENADADAEERDNVRSDVEDVTTGSGHDLIDADTRPANAVFRNNELDGRGGADRLHGGTGADDLIGRDGSDVLIGGPGGDGLSGDAGIDRFRARDGDFDVLTDTFVKDEEDLVDADSFDRLGAGLQGGADAPAATATAPVTCNFDPGSGLATVTVTVYAVTVRIVNDAGTITVNGKPCGAATATSTDRIEVHGELQTLKLDLATPLTPGRTSEGPAVGDAEIEVEALNVGKLHLLGGKGPERWTVGTGGMNLNDDGDGDDVTWGHEGQLRIDSLGGDDVLSLAGGAGAGSPYEGFPEVYGGGGDDTVTGGGAGDTLDGGPGHDTIEGGLGVDTVRGGTGFDTLSGGENGDNLCGGTGDDTLAGGAGRDSFDQANAFDPSDLRCGATEDDGADTVAGGPGRDRMWGYSRTRNVHVTLDDIANDGEAGEGDNVRADIEEVSGGSGDDVLDADTVATRGRASFRSLSGGGGDDRLYGPAHGESGLHGDDGNDVLHGGGQTDVLEGEDGDDLLVGGDDRDSLYGDSILGGGLGADDLRGGDGNDHLDGGAGDDRLSGGPGVDASSRLVSEAFNVIVTLDDVANDGADVDQDGVADGRENVMADVERIATGEGNDVLDADTPVTNALFMTHILEGRGGADRITAGNGEDVLDGGADNDNLTAGPGSDVILGGPGQDAIFALDGDFDQIAPGGEEPFEMDAFDFVLR